MIRARRHFDRGDHWLVVDTLDGSRKTWTEPKGEIPPPQHGVAYVRLEDSVMVVDTRNGNRLEYRLANEQDGEGPGQWQKAINYTKAVASHVAHGVPMADAETIEKRFSTCLNCPSGLFRPVDRDSTPKHLRDLPIVGTCTHLRCGCVIHNSEVQPNKLSWLDQRCPESHW